jgi:hypothetical protein
MPQTRKALSSRQAAGEMPPAKNGRITKPGQALAPPQKRAEVAKKAATKRSALGEITNAVSFFSPLFANPKRPSHDVHEQ